jgi:hypothetical protein
MAGDWIKMRTNLDSNVRVIELASLLGLPELHVVGCLWKLWAWADTHTHDGNAIRVTGVTLDRFTGVDGFADALRKVGWLEGRDNALTFPRFAEHNGQTAKKRAETNQRVATHRNAKAVTDVTRIALPEKRREEKKEKEKYEKEKVPKAEEASPLLERLPAALNTEEFRGMWMRWTAYCFHRDGRHNEPQLEMNLMTLQERIQQGGISKAITDLRYSIESGTKGRIYDSAADFSRKPAPPPAPKPDPYAGFLHIKRKASVAS